MRVFSIAACLACALAPSIALAQTARTGSFTAVDQIGLRDPAGDGAAVAQIGRDRAAAATVRDSTSSAQHNEFAAPPTAAHAPPSQINANTRQAPSPAQLTFGPAVADAPSSPTRRAEGLNTTTQTLTGRDRCDPRETGAAGGICREVIETRAAEFKAPDVQPLSPEQRLMVSQRALTDNNQDLGRATRRLANGDVDDTNAGMAIASLAVASTSQQPDEEPESAEPSATDAIVAGIVASLGGQSPP